jgi:hypothetical protein
MTLPQGSGAGLGAILAGVLVNVLDKYAGYKLDLTAAAAISASGIAAGGVLGHAIVNHGIRGILRILWRGK